MKNRMKNTFLVALVAVLTVLAVPAAHASSPPAPGDPCSAARTGYSLLSDQTLLVCDGATWNSVLEYDQAGKVGIGTATPASLLQVLGGIQLGDDAATCPGASNVKVGTLRYNGSLQVCGTGGWTGVSASGGNNVAPTISFSGGGTLTVTLADNIPLYESNSHDAWDNYGTLPSFLVGTRGTDTVNGTPDGSAVTLTITGGPAVCYQMRNEGGWSPVNTTGWSVKATAPADFTTFAPGGIDMIRERVFQPGSYTLDSFSAMYACSTSPVGGGSPGGSSTQVQFNDGGAFAGAAQLYWDKANNRLGIGTATPAVDLEVSGIMRAIDDAAGCAAAERGAIRFNSGAGVLEVCNEGAWSTLASGGSGLTGYEVVQVDQPAGAAVGWYWAACPGTKKVLGGSCTAGSGSAVTNTQISGQSFGCYKATTSTNYQIKAACAEGSGGGGSGSPLWSAGTGDNIYFNSGSSKVGIGTASLSPNNATTVIPNLISAQNVAAGGIQVARYTTPGGGGGILTLSANRGTDVNTYTALANGDGIGSVMFGGADGSQYVTSAQIGVQVDGAVSANNVPGRLMFLTSPGGANSATERMRITSTGNVGIGTTNPGQKLTVAGTLESTSGGIKFPDGTTQTSAAALPSSCTVIYDKLVWDGSSWKCESDVALIGGKSPSDCTTEGGTVIDTGSGKLCRFDNLSGTGGNCPSGWVQHENWSETVSNHANPNCGNSCWTTTVPWSNTVKSKCTCAAVGVCGPCEAMSDYSNPAIRKIGCI